MHWTMLQGGFLLGFFCAVAYAGSGGVIQLNGENFDSVVANNKLVVVTFGAYWCRFSQMMGPVWLQLAQSIIDPQYTGVEVAAVECDQNKDLQVKWGITKYPTVKAWKNGQLLPKEYRGPRTVQHFKEYIDSLMAPAVSILESKDEYKQAGDKRLMVGLFSGPESPEMQPFTAVAEGLRTHCEFQVTFNSGILGRGRTPPLVVFHHENFEADYPINVGEPSDIGKFTEWATKQCKPLVDEITFENGEELTEEGLPFFIMFTSPDDKESRQQFVDAVKNNVEHERHRIKFLVADGHMFEHPLHHMGKTVNDLPVIAIDSFKHMYDFGGMDKLSQPGAMQEFINDLFSGKLHNDYHNQNAQLPPASDMQKLGPSKKRYSFERDEL